MDKKILKELGLTNNEIEVYLSLLRKGSISVNEIAEMSGLHRQACYDALDRLLEKEFVSFVTKNNKKYFQGIHPEKIVDYIKEKEEKFKLILPALLDITKLPKENTFVEVFKGKGTQKSVFRDVIRELEKQKGEVLISGIDESKVMEDAKFALIQYLRQIKKMGCSERILVEEGDTCFVEGDQTEYRWLPAKSFSSLPIYVYGNKTTILIWGNPNYAIIIENRELAETYRKQFNVLWEVSKRIPENLRKSKT